MSGVHHNIRAALRARLLAMSPLPVDQDQIAWEGRPFTKTARTPWLRETLKPSGSALASLGPNAVVRHEGLLFLDYFTPSGDGYLDADDTADLIVGQFAPGLTLTASGQTVILRSSSRLDGRIEADWIMVPIRVRWYADTLNTL